MMTVQPVIAFAWNAAVGIPLLIVGIIVLALIWLFGQPKKEQGKRRVVPGPHSTERREPTLGGEPAEETEAGFSGFDSVAEAPVDQKQGELEVGMREELERLGATLSGERQPPVPTPAVSRKPKLTLLPKKKIRFPELQFLNCTILMVFL